VVWEGWHCEVSPYPDQYGLLEIKAPLPHTQIEYWISGEVNERFRPQLQGQLYGPKIATEDGRWRDNAEETGMLNRAVPHDRWQVNRKGCLAHTERQRQTAERR
jgi:hypothetical protein